MPSRRILLAPGASGSIERLRPHASFLEAHGHEVELVTLPRASAERAVPAYHAALAASTGAGAVIGGHSFGGRVASLLASELDEGPAALVLLSYPLHPPGRSEAWAARTAHWSQIGCPVLLLCGEADPFARIDLLRTAVKRLPRGDLATYPRVGHTLAPVLDDALERLERFIDGLP